MGYPSWLDGEIAIDPPLTAAELKDSPYVQTGGDYDYRPNVRIKVVDKEVATEIGPVVISVGVGIEPNEWFLEGERGSAYTVEEDLRGIAAHHDLAGDRMCGVMHRVGEQSGDVERYWFNEAGELKTETAELRWPDGELVPESIYEP